MRLASQEASAAYNLAQQHSTADMQSLISSPLRALPPPPCAMPGPLPVALEAVPADPVGQGPAGHQPAVSLQTAVIPTPGISPQISSGLSPLTSGLSPSHLTAFSALTSGFSPPPSASLLPSVSHMLPQAQPQPQPQRTAINENVNAAHARSFSEVSFCFCLVSVMFLSCF